MTLITSLQEILSPRIVIILNPNVEKGKQFPQLFTPRLHYDSFQTPMSLILIEIINLILDIDNASQRSAKYVYIMICN